MKSTGQLKSSNSFCFYESLLDNVHQKLYLIVSRDQVWYCDSNKRSNNNNNIMVDIIPSSQLVIGNGAFSIVYRARLKLVSLDSLSYKSFLDVILGLENVNISCINGESFLGDKLVVQMCRNPSFKTWTLPYLHSCGQNIDNIFWHKTDHFSKAWQFET